MTVGLSQSRQVSLPFGVAGGVSGRHRLVRVRPIDGRTEFAASAHDNSLAAAREVLCGVLVRLGPFSGDEVDAALVGTLSLLDRDALLVDVDVETFGAVRYKTLICPHCAKRVDLRLDLRELVPDSVPETDTVRVVLDDGHTVIARLPCVADQLVLKDVPDNSRARYLLDRCVLTGGDVGPEALDALDGQVLERLAATLIAATPTLERTLDLACVECSGTFRFTYEPAAELVQGLRNHRRALLQEFHTLAFYYHWSHSDILALPRTLRQEYLELLERQVRGPNGGTL